MEKVIKIFKSFKEQEKADKLYWQSISPKEKIDILEQIRKQAIGVKYGSQRFQRVFRIIKQKQS